MDHKLIANITLQKLINAQLRGVRTILIIDDLNFYASRKYIKKLKQSGGIVVKNNPFERAGEHLMNGKY